jgi:hypothetical protein
MEDPCLYCGAHVQVHAHLVDSRVATIPKQMRGDERERAGVDELGRSRGCWVRVRGWRLPSASHARHAVPRRH